MKKSGSWLVEGMCDNFIMPFFDMMMKKVIIILNMLGALMKDIIVCYLDSTLVVTNENSRPRKSDSHIFL